MKSSWQKLSVNDYFTLKTETLCQKPKFHQPRGKKFRIETLFWVKRCTVKHPYQAPSVTAALKLKRLVENSDVIQSCTKFRFVRTSTIQVMTNRGGGEAVLPRPVAVVPVAKPRGKLNTLAPSSASAGPETTTNHYVNQGAVPKSPRNSSPGDTDTMTKTKAILNEAADAVAKSFAKQTQGINKGRQKDFTIL